MQRKKNADNMIGLMLNFIDLLEKDMTYENFLRENKIIALEKINANQNDTIDKLLEEIRQLKDQVIINREIVNGLCREIRQLKNNR